MDEADPSTRIFSSTFNLLQAPVDVQRSVLLALNTRELILCQRVGAGSQRLTQSDIMILIFQAQVCRSLANLIKNDIAVRYKLALALSGRIDGIRPIPIVDRLTVLREHRAKVHAGDDPLPRAPRPPVGFLPTRSGMVIVDDSVAFWRPGTASTGIDELKIVHSTQRLGIDGHRTGSCVVDVAQDLLVFSRRITTFDPLQVTTECCIYSLKEGHPHPLASRSHIPSNLDFQYSVNVQIYDDIQVLGDLFAWNVHNGERREMSIFNWKTGVMVWHLTGPVILWHCRLISQSHVVVVSHQSLLIYSIDPHRDTPPPSSADELPSLGLDLPALSKNVDGIHHGSITSHIQFPPVPGPDDAPIFRHDPDLTVLTIYLELRVTSRRQTVTIDPYAVFIPISTLKARLAMPIWMHRPPRTVPWGEWGPAGTRIVHFEFPCALSSMGCVVAATQRLYTGGGGAVLNVCVFDVHPWARFDGRRLQDARGVVYARNTLLKTPGFGDRIRTMFPFEFALRHIQLGPDELSAEVGLTEDGLVLSVVPYPPDEEDD